MSKSLVRVVSTQDNKTLQIRFSPTDICNFNCSYCFPGSGNIGKYRFPKNINTVIKNFRLMFNVYKDKVGKERFHFTIEGGGEPTLWPHIEQFCKELKESHDVYITLITNGSRTLRWWEENLGYFDDVVLSTHHEFVDVDHQCAVGDLLYEAGVKITALVLMDAKNWNKCIGIIEKMKQSIKPWFIEAKAIIDAPGHGMDIYNEEQLEYLKTNIKRLPDSEWILKRVTNIGVPESILLFNDGTAVPSKPHDIILNKWNYFEGWSCNVALDTLMISYSGTVTGSCQEPLFKDTKLNIFSETFEEDFNTDIKLTPIICPRKSCECQLQTHITKHKI